MSAGLRGNVTSLMTFSQNLRRLPRVVAMKVAKAAAPTLTSAAKATFDAGEDAFGVSWVPGSAGRAVTLRKTGSLARQIQYVAVGTLLRVALGVRYAKYQLGRRPAFPRQGDPLPAPYVRALETATAEVCRAELGVSP